MGQEEVFLNHDGWVMLRHCGGQQLGAGSQSLGSPGVNSGVSPEGRPCRPKWPLALTSVESAVATRWSLVLA